MNALSYATNQTPEGDAIGWYRRALLRLVIGMLGILGDGTGVMPRAIASRVRRVLVPAEAAVRRLIVVLAQGLPVQESGVRAGPVGPIAGAGGPRVPAFPLFDRRKYFSELVLNPRIAPGAEPRISFLDEDRSGPAEVVAAPETGARMYRRLSALHGALEDLPKQARRLRRVLARRGGSGRAGPLRIGAPPGYRERQTRSIDGILAECDRLARPAQRLDSS